MNNSESHRSSSMSPSPPDSQNVFADDATSSETVELLSDFGPSHYGVEEMPASGDPDEIIEGNAGATGKPNINIRRLLAIMPLLAIAASVTMAPKIEVYTLLACSVDRPEIFSLPRPAPEPPIFNYISVDSSPFDTAVPSISTHQPPFTDSTCSQPHVTRNFVNGSEPDRHSRCASYPVVKTAVAKLTTVIAACTGFLMCITTGWWGSFSDRHGRKIVMIVSTLSMLITDLNFILAASFTKHVPGGYWFLLIGPIADGIFGGMTIGIIAIQSYIADATHESDRSSAFSFALGLLFSGMAFGPTLGSLFIHFTGSLVSVFYLSAVLHALYALCVVVLIKESLTWQQMDESRVRYFTESAVVPQDNQSLSVYLLVKLKSFFAFLTPLAVFFPTRAGDGNPLKRAKRDWSLTIVIVGYSFTYCVVGAYSYKFQYAVSTFGWTSEELGYWLGVIGASRAVYLSLILPVIIKIFKPTPVTIEVPVDTTFSSEATEEIPSSSLSPLLSKPIKKEVHSSAFDLNLARYSLLIEAVAFAGMGLSRTSMPFSIFGAVGAMGAGFGPAAEAIILTLYTRRGDTEKGKLLGAVGVVQAICSQIIGPAAFGLIYMKTVAAHPRAIFVASVSTALSACLLLSFVRLPKASHSGKEVPVDSEDQDSSVQI